MLPRPLKLPPSFPHKFTSFPSPPLSQNHCPPKSTTPSPNNYHHSPHQFSQINNPKSTFPIHNQFSQTHLHKSTIPIQIQSQNHCPNSQFSQTYCPKSTIQSKLSQTYCSKSRIESKLSQNFCAKSRISILNQFQFSHQKKGELNRFIGFCGLRFAPFSCRGKGSNPMGKNKEDQWPKSDFSPSTASFSPQENRDKFTNKPPASTKLLTLPTILTIGRVAAVPFLIGSFYVESWWGPPATTCIFIAAAITDWLDGYLARRMKLGTAFGAFLDPVADKLMVAATLVLLCTRPMEAGILGQAPWLIPVPAIAIIGREITMSAVREWAASQGSKLSEAVAVNNLGKWKTAAQMIALTILLGTRGSSIVGTETLVTSGVLLLYFSAWLAVWSLYVYMRKIWKVLLM